MILTRARTGAVNLAVKGVNASERREEDARQALAGKIRQLEVILLRPGVRRGNGAALERLIGRRPDVTRVIRVGPL